MKRLKHPGIFLALAALLIAPAVRAGEQTWKVAYSLDGVHEVRVSNINGAVTATTWDRNYVRVTATENGSRRRIENTQIVPSQQDGVIRIRTLSRHRHHFFVFFGGPEVARVDYELLLPAQMEVSLETVNGTVSTKDRQGTQRLNTVNGRVDAENTFGAVHAETVNGGIFVHYAKFAGETHLSTVNGSIEAEIPSGSSVSYHLSTINGGISAGDQDYSGHGWGGKTMTGTLDGGGISFHASTVNGSIHIRYIKN